MVKKYGESVVTMASQTSKTSSAATEVFVKQKLIALLHENKTRKHFCTSQIIFLTPPILSTRVFHYLQFSYFCIGLGPFLGILERGMVRVVTL